MRAGLNAPHLCRWDIISAGNISNHWGAHTARVKANDVELWSYDLGQQDTGETDELHAASTGSSGIDKNWATIPRRIRWEARRPSYEGYNSLVTVGLRVVKWDLGRMYKAR
jgi:hypothetical protein